VVTTVRSQAKADKIKEAHPNVDSSKLSFAIVEDIVSALLEQVHRNLENTKAIEMDDISMHRSFCYSPYPRVVG
jgi:hypothetical protein